MPVFPKRRCPDCATVGCGRICAACRRALWTLHYHHLDPEGHERLADGEGLAVGAVKGDPTRVVLSYWEPDPESTVGRLVEKLYDGAPVVDLGYLWLDCYGGEVPWKDLVHDPTGSGSGGPPEIPRPETPMEARNRFCYERRKAGGALKEIMAEVNRTLGWEPTETTQGVIDASDAHSKRLGEDPFRTRSPRDRGGNQQAISKVADKS